MNIALPTFNTTKLDDFLKTVHMMFDDFRKFDLPEDMFELWLFTINKAYEIGYNQCVMDLLTDTLGDDNELMNIDKRKVM